MADSSNDPVTIRLDFGENAMHSTGAVCDLRCRSGLGVGWVNVDVDGSGWREWIWDVQSSEAVATYNPSDDIDMPLIPVQLIVRNANEDTGRQRSTSFMTPYRPYVVTSVGLPSKLSARSNIVR